MSRRPAGGRRIAARFAGNFVAWAGAAVILLPVLWVLSNAFKRKIDIITGTLIAPPTLRNFGELLFSRQSHFLWNILNSLGVAAASTAIVLVLASLAAYSLSRLAVPGWVRWAILGWALLFQMLPTLTFVGAWYVMWAALGLKGSYLALILTHVVHNLPMGLFLMLSFMSALPSDLFHAARLDGCTEAQIFRRIAFPLVRGGLIAAGALIFIFSWGDFAIALTLGSPRTMTVPVAISTFAQEYDIRYGEMAAGTLLSILPALVLILFGQRFVVRGLLAGAIK